MAATSTTAPPAQRNSSTEIICGIPSAVVPATPIPTRITRPRKRLRAVSQPAIRVSAAVEWRQATKSSTMREAPIRKSSGASAPLRPRGVERSRVLRKSKDPIGQFCRRSEGGATRGITRRTWSTMA